MTTVHDPEVVAYLGAVRAALADLTPEDRDELLEGLEADLAELRRESGVTLFDRLGPAIAYAEELRTAAGIPAPASRGAWGVRGMTLALQRARSAPVVSSTLAFLPELRPGWWVLRGYAVAWGLAYGIWHDSPGPVVRVNDGLLPGLLLVAAAVLGSVWVGRRTNRAPWLGTAVVVGNIAVVLAVLVCFHNINDHFASFGAGGEPTPGLARDGTQIAKLYVYGPDGKPVRDARVFDENGAAVLGYDDVATAASPLATPGPSWPASTISPLPSPSARSVR